VGTSSLTHAYTLDHLFTKTCTSKFKYLKYKKQFIVGKCLMYKNIIRYISIQITIYIYTFLRKERKAYAVCG
jgi:hypothetical protein